MRNYNDEYIQDIDTLISELQKVRKKYGNLYVEVQGYINDVEKSSDRLALFGLNIYNVDAESNSIQIYCEDKKWNK